MDIDDEDWCEVHLCVKDEDGCEHCKDEKADRDYQDYQDRFPKGTL